MITSQEFRGILGFATILVGLAAIIWNDKVVGVGLVTGGMAIVSSAVSENGTQQNQSVQQ